MRTSFFITIFILVAAFMLHRHGSRRLMELTERHSFLIQQKQTPGTTASVSTDTASSPRDRATAIEEARQFTRDMIRLANEISLQKKSGEPPDSAMLKRSARIPGLLRSLTAYQLQLVIPETISAPDVSDDLRQGMLNSYLTVLAEKSPANALELLDRHSNLIGARADPAGIACKALAAWARAQPEEARAWIRSNGPRHPDWITDSAKLPLLIQTAHVDPQATFALLEQLEIADRGSAITKICAEASTPAVRKKVWDALREYLETLADSGEKQALVRAAIQRMTPGISGAGQIEASKWLKDASLDPPALEAFAEAIPFNSKAEETTAWILWIGAALPSASADAPIRRLFSRWIAQDHVAAGRWLNGQPAGGVKSICVRTFAETVASQDPEAARQWALTLPPGPERDKLLRKSVLPESSDTHKSP